MKSDIELFASREENKGVSTPPSRTERTPLVENASSSRTSCCVEFSGIWLIVVGLTLGSGLLALILWKTSQSEGDNHDWLPSDFRSNSSDLRP